MPSRLPSLLAAAAVGWCAATAARAGTADLGQHPAVIVKARPAMIDPNRFVVAPPATVNWTRGHANADHPAVQVALAARHAALDANTFTVQPPASVTWTPAPAETPVAAAHPPTALLR